MENRDEKMTWLVVEDDASFRDIVTTMCELWGVKTIVFSDGHQVVAWMERLSPEGKEDLPNLALLDIRMPGPQGHEVAALIRRHPLLSNIGIILMTAYELPGSEQDQVLAASGADLLMFKPLPTMEELLQIGREVISRRHSAKQSE